MVFISTFGKVSRWIRISKWNTLSGLVRWTSLLFLFTLIDFSDKKQARYGCHS